MQNEALHECHVNIVDANNDNDEKLSTYVSTWLVATVVVAFLMYDIPYLRITLVFFVTTYISGLMYYLICGVWLVSRVHKTRRLSAELKTEDDYIRNEDRILECIDSINAFPLALDALQFVRALLAVMTALTLIIGVL